METKSLWNESTTTTFVDRLTKQYRYDVLNLCQQSNTVETWETAQHLLDQCWSQKDVVSDDCQSIVYLCSTCGASLYPGWDGTRLRVARFPSLKAERTRRRRMQRQKRREFIVQKKKAKEFKPHKTPQQQNGDKTSEPIVVEKVVLQDDPNLEFDRHHIVILCGRCQSKVRLKGLKREFPLTKQIIQQKQESKKRIQNFKQQDKIVATDPRESVKDDVATKSAVDGDFLQLPPGPPMTTKGTKVQHSKSSQWTLQNPKKEKKKSKQGDNNKKNKLFNFLSSLND